MTSRCEAQRGLRGEVGVVQSSLQFTMAHTVFPLTTGVQPQRSAKASTICRPRPRGAVTSRGATRPCDHSSRLRCHALRWWQRDTHKRHRPGTIPAGFNGAEQLTP